MGKANNINEDLKLATSLVDKLGIRQIILLIILVVGWYFVQRPVDNRQTEMDKKQIVILETIVEKQEEAVTKQYLHKVTENLYNKVSVDITESEKRNTRNIQNTNRAINKEAEDKRLENMIKDLDNKLDHMYPKIKPIEPELLNSVPLEDTTMAFIVKRKIYN